MSDIRPGLDIQELTVGATDLDVLNTYKATAKELRVVSGTGALVIQTPGSKSEATPTYRTITVAAGFSLEMPIYVVRGTNNGTAAAIKLQLIFR